MATEFTFDQIFSNSLAQSRNLAQRRREESALNSFRQRQLGLQRQDLTQRAEEARRRDDLQRQLQDLRERQFESDFVTVEDAETAGIFGVEPGARIPASTFYDVTADPADIPLSPGLQDILGTDAVDPRTGSAEITSATQLEGIQRQLDARDQGRPSPENIRGNIMGALQGLNRLQGQLSNPELGLEEAELIQQRANLMNAFLENQLSRASELDLSLSDLFSMEEEEDPIPGFDGTEESGPTIRDPRTGQRVPLNTEPFQFGAQTQSPQDALRRLIMGSGPVPDLDAAIRALPR